jgi:hypothetical protein
VDEQLVDEFSDLPAEVVHREVALVAQGLLGRAHFTDHVVVLTGRFAAEYPRDLETLAEAPASGLGSS